MAKKEWPGDILCVYGMILFGAIFGLLVLPTFDGMCIMGFVMMGIMSGFLVGPNIIWYFYERLS